MEIDHFCATQIESVKLPCLDLVKTHGSSFIARNPNRSIKVHDFQGYTQRRDIHDGFYDPCD